MRAETARTEATALPGLRPRAGRFRFGRGRAVVLLLAFLASVGAGYVGYQRLSTPAAPALSGTPTAVRRGSINATISLTGAIASTSQAKLAFESTGRLAELLVKEGNNVKKGDALAKLDTANLELQVAQAEVALEKQRADLAQLKAGAREVEVAAARASYDSAVAKYNDLKASPKREDVAAAEAGVRDAEVALANARSNLVLVQKSDTVSRTVRDRENEHNYYEVAYGATLAKFKEGGASQADLDREWSNLLTAKERLDSARTSAAMAQRQAENSVAQAEESLRKAKDNLGKLRAGPTPEQLKSAEAAMLSAKSQLETKTAGPSATDIAAQEVAVRQAEANLNQQKLLLQKATLAAPFDGVIDAIAANVGEQVPTSGVLTLVNLERFRIDARVDESDVSRLAVGQTAAVTVDALSNARLTARVTFIAATPTVQQGVVSYPVVLELDPAGTRVRPGMSASAAVEVERRDNVLLVPNRAVRTEGRNRVAEVLSNGKREMRPITVGLSSDQSTEITSGLQEGEQVIIPATTTALPRTSGGPGGVIGIGVPGLGGPPR